MDAHRPPKWRARNPSCVAVHPCCRVVARRNGLTNEEPESAEPANLALPCQGPIMAAARREYPITR